MSFLVSHCTELYLDIVLFWWWISGNSQVISSNQGGLALTIDSRQCSLVKLTMIKVLCSLCILTSEVTVVGQTVAAYVIKTFFCPLYLQTVSTFLCLLGLYHLFLYELFLIILYKMGKWLETFSTQVFSGEVFHFWTLRASIVNSLGIPDVHMFCPP